MDNMNRPNINVITRGPEQAPSLYQTLALLGNLPFSDQIFGKSNYKFIIKWDFDLHNVTVQLPANCILEFDGGSLSNGKLICEDTIFDSILPESEVLKNINLTGTYYWNLGQVRDKKFSPLNNSGMGRIYLHNSVNGYPNNTWIYVVKNNIPYLLFAWKNKLYPFYDGDKGLVLENNLVTEYYNYNIDDITEYVEDRQLSYFKVGNTYTLNLPDGSTISSDTVNNTNIYKYDPNHVIQVLAQDMFTQANTIYIIQHDFDLNNDTVTIPANCVLEFDGGSLSNGTIVGQNTLIKAENIQVFSDIVLRGTFINEYYIAEWFINNHESADTGINSAVENAYKTEVFEVRLTRNEYCIQNPIELFNKCRLVGLDGEVRTPSRGTFKNVCSVSVIYVTANVDGIIVHSYAGDGDHLNSVCIKNIFLNYNPSNTKSITYNNSIKSNYGIHVRNVDGQGNIRRSAFRCSNFKNVVVVNFRYGIYCQNTDYYPTGSTEWNKVVCAYNHVGMKVEAYGEDSETNKVWTNVFHLNYCIFAWNYIGGVYWNNVPWAELLVFYGCVFEQNGLNYNPDMISDTNEHPLSKTGKKVGAYAFRADHYGTIYGQTSFEECYFEFNYFRRNNGPTVPIREDEVSRNEWIYPEDIRVTSYMLFSERMHLAVTKCRINGQICFVYIRYAGLIFDNNSCTYYLSNVSQIDNIEINDHFIFIDFFFSAWRQKLVVRDIFDNTKDIDYTMLSEIKSYVKFDKLLLDTWVNAKQREDFDINVPFEAPVNIQMYTFDCDIYMDNNSPYAGIGLKGAKQYDIFGIDRILNAVSPPARIYNVYIPIATKEHSFGTTSTSAKYTHACGYNISPEGFPSEYFTENDNVLYPAFAVNRAKDTPSLNFPDFLPTLRKNSVTDARLVQNDIIINSCYIVNQNTNTSPVINVVGGKKVEINNCIINFMSGLYPFVTSEVSDLTIIFNNCSFIYNRANGNRIWITDNKENKVVYNHCNVVKLSNDRYVDDSNPIIVEYNKIGTTAQRPDFDKRFPVGYEYFDTELGKPIYWLVNTTYLNGTWVDATGATV